MKGHCNFFSWMYDTLSNVLTYTYIPDFLYCAAQIVLFIARSRPLSCANSPTFLKIFSLVS